MSDSDETEVLETTIKITVVGEPATGKSALCARYLGRAEAGVCGGGGGGGGGTRGAEVLAGQCRELRPPVPLQLCDVAGAARDTSMLDNYLYASHIVLLVYDLTNLASFQNLDCWMGKIKAVFHQQPQPLVAMFGNKADLEHQRAVRMSCARRFASAHMLQSYKGSARTGDAVNSTITALVAKVLGASVQVRRFAQTQTAYSTRASRSTHSGDSNGRNSEVTQPLIMHRKAFRDLHWKARSSVCALQ